MKHYCNNCEQEPLYFTEDYDPDSENFGKECCPFCGSTQVSSWEPEEEGKIKQFAAELEKMKTEKPIPVILPPLAIFAIISHIQIASRHPLADTAITEIAIDTAHQLQKLFNPESYVYQVLEFGWNPKLDRPIEKT